MIRLPRLPLRLLPAACLAMIAGVARADIPNFTFVGIEGVGDLEGQLDDRLGITNNADEHIINITDCEAYAGGEVTVKVRIDPKPTGSWQYAVAYAAPGHTCSTSDANPEATDGCYVPAAQRELTTTSLEFDVNLDELIGSACDSGDDGDATLYVILQNTSASEVKYETIIVNVDLKRPAAPVLDEVTSGDARFTAKWTDDSNNEDDLEYDVYYSDAPFTDADLAAVDEKKGLTAKSVAIEDGISNEVTYYVSVAARDAADNESLISNQIEVVPASTTDFWEAYKGAGGADTGCGGGSLLFGLGPALAALALLVRRSRRAALALVALAVPVGAARAESPRTMMLELHGGSYAPDVDAEFNGAATPWKDAFGSSSMTLLRMHLDYELWQGFGTLAVGGGFGYGWIDGTARNAEGDKTDDHIGFNLMPLQASLIYRWDWAAVEHGVPFVPYGKVGITGALWWATDAKDDVSNTADGEGRGFTLGWHAAAGLMFLLDVFSESMSVGFDSESGVNNSFVFVEYQHTALDNFGAGDSIVLSDDALSFGLAFEF